MSESNQIPDSISSDKLKQLLGKIAPEMPLSQVIPELSFRDEKSDSGGLCDLQFVICQLVEKSKSGLEYHQILTASLYLFERCVFFLARASRKQRPPTSRRTSTVSSPSCTSSGMHSTSCSLLSLIHI